MAGEGPSQEMMSAHIMNQLHNMGGGGGGGLHGTPGDPRTIPGFLQDKEVQAIAKNKPLFGILHVGLGPGVTQVGRVALSEIMAPAPTPFAGKMGGVWKGQGH